MLQIVGGGPALNSGPTCEINGKIVGFRRMGMRDSPELISVISEMISWLSLTKTTSTVDLKQLLKETFFNLGTGEAESAEDGDADKNDRVAGVWATVLQLLFAYPGISKAYFSWLSTMLFFIEDNKKTKVTMEDLDNPDLFPIGSEITLTTALAKHPDLLAFFTKARSLLTDPKLPEKIEQMTEQVGNAQ